LAATLYTNTWYQVRRIHCLYRSGVEKFYPASLIAGVKAPPPELRDRVHGSTDIPSFIAVGQQAAAEIHAIAGDHPITNVLDFGCGCGRVITFLHELRKATYIGVDVDQDAVKWSQENHVVWRKSMRVVWHDVYDGGIRSQAIPRA
jgi:SAM-dependent methyltransferase